MRAISERKKKNLSSYIQKNEFQLEMIRLLIGLLDVLFNEFIVGCKRELISFEYFVPSPDPLPITIGIARKAAHGVRAMWVGNL